MVKKQLAVGSMLATAGALGVLLSLLLDWTSLPRPYSFLVGLACGLMAGLGAALALHGLWLSRRARQRKARR